MEHETATTENVVNKVKEIIYGSYLKDEIVAVKPVQSSGKWANLLVSGQDNKKDPFIYNKVKRSYQIPLKNYRQGGGVVSILDDQERLYIKKYINSYPDGMTQREFFEKELGKDLNPTLGVDDNFWRMDKNSRVTITRKGLSLNLREPLDMLKYLILLSNKMLISPSYEESTKKATYEFMLVDEGKLTSKKVEDHKITTKAYVEFARLADSKEKMINFIKSLGRVIPGRYDEDWLYSEVKAVLENSAINFLNIISDPQYDAKIFVQKAVDAGAILRKSDKRYTLDNGIELGDLLDTIRYLEDKANHEMKLRVKGKIEMAKIH